VSSLEVEASALNIAFIGLGFAFFAPVYAFTSEVKRTLQYWTKF
jgi:hypothetical protein